PRARPPGCRAFRASLYRGGPDRDGGQWIRRPGGERVRWVPRSPHGQRRRGCSADCQGVARPTRPDQSMSGVAAYFAAVEAPYTLALQFGDVPVAVRTNHPEVQTRLRRYFSPFVVSGVGDERTEVTLVQGSVEPRGSFLDVERGLGRRVKEAVQEVAGGRLILKRATGVLMGLQPGSAYAQGDLLTNLNQAVNLINAAYAKRVLRRGHV